MRQKLAFAAVMGAVTTGIISFTLVGVNLGFAAGFFGTRLKSWAMAYVVVIPCILVIAPRVQRLVDRFFEKTDNNA